MTALAKLCSAFIILALVGVGRAAEWSPVQVGYGGIAGYQFLYGSTKEPASARNTASSSNRCSISGGALNMQALLAGSIQMSQNSASSAIQAALRGAPVVLDRSA